jgi:hypothetical protein
MEDIFRDMDKTDVFIDDVGAFSNDHQSHLVSLKKALKLLEDNGFTVNPLKCKWAVKETDWLGSWLTPTGLKPWNKKIKAILQMDAPKDVKQVRSFLGAVHAFLDSDLQIHTDHRNLTHQNLNSQRALRWRLFLEEHTPAFHCVKGEKNVVADAFSQLPVKTIVWEKSCVGPGATPTATKDDAFAIELDDPALLESSTPRRDSLLSFGTSRDSTASIH